MSPGPKYIPAYPLKIGNELSTSPISFPLSGRHFLYFCMGIVFVIITASAAFSLDSSDKFLTTITAGKIYSPPDPTALREWVGAYEQSAGAIKMKLVVNEDRTFAFSYNADRWGSEENAEKHSVIFLTADQIAIMDVRSYNVIIYRRESINGKTILLSDIESTHLRLASREEGEKLRANYATQGRIKIIAELK